MPEGPKKASAKGLSPPQELEEGPRSGPHLLVRLKAKVIKIYRTLLQTITQEQSITILYIPHKLSCFTLHLINIFLDQTEQLEGVNLMKKDITLHWWTTKVVN